jgi:hypothetical protein
VAAAAAAAAAQEADETAALYTAASKVLPVEDDVMVCVHSGSAALCSRSTSISIPEQPQQRPRQQQQQQQQQRSIAAAPSRPEEDLEQANNTTAAEAVAAAAAADSERQLLLGAKRSPFAAAATSAVLPHARNITQSTSSSRAGTLAPGSLTGCCSSELGRSLSPCYSSSSSSSSSSKLQALLAVARNRVVLYAGCWRILHDIPGNGILYYTPMIVQAMLLAGGGAGGGFARRPEAVVAPQLPGVALNSSSSSGLTAAGLATGAISTISTNSSSSSSSLGATAEPAERHASSPGAYVVLLSAIPYAAASLFHLANAWHSQRSSEWRWHIAGAWLLGAAALLLLPAAAAGRLASASTGAAAAAAGTVSVATSVAAFALLTLAHVGVNGANGVQTGLVAANIVPQEKALGLAMYNTIGCFGSFWGPVIIGVLHDATGGYAVGMWLLGVSLAAAAAMVARFRPEQLDCRLVRM